VFISVDEHGMVTNLALPESAGQSLKIKVANGIYESDLEGVIVHHFASVPRVLIISNMPVNTEANTTGDPAGGTMVNVLSSLTTNGSAAVTNSTWIPYVFNGVIPTSKPQAIAGSNGGVFMGTSTSTGGGLLAIKALPGNTTDPIYVATPSACNASAQSTSATTLYPFTITGGNLPGNYLAIGTNNGELLIYGLSGIARGGCKSLTLNSQALTSYATGSPIIAISYTGINSNSYFYFLTQRGEIWRIAADKNQVPLSFSRLNGNAFTGDVPPRIAGGLTTLYADSNNNLFVGGLDSNLYLLATVGSKVNTKWTSASVTEPGINYTTAATDGSTIAVTNRHLYSVGMQ
jgi:hypothetical protein